jgi:hypothetical protein
MAQVPSYVPQTTTLATLRAWYNFNGNGNDASGNGYHLTQYPNAPSGTTDRFGSTNAAKSFNGVDNGYYVENLPASTFGTGSGSAAWSAMSAWVKRNSGSSAGGIVQRGDRSNQGANTETSRIWIDASAAGGIVCDGNSYVTLSESHSGTDWVHVVVVFSGNHASLGVNGAVVQSDTFQGADNFLSTLRLGYLTINGAQGNYFSGKIDDVGIWDGFLTECEIKNLYNSCTFSNLADQSAGVGGSITLTAPMSCYSTVGYTYQWQRDNGTGWANLTSAGQYSGATSNQLTISNLTMTNNGEHYRCVMDNGPLCSATNSDDMTLTVLATGVNDPATAGAIASIYPNPSDGHFNFTHELHKAGSTLIVTDMMGKTVYSQKLSALSVHEVLDLAFLPNGMYHWNIQEASKKVAHGKISIVK